MYDIIKKLCKENQTTIQKLEAEIGFSNGTINKWDTKRPSVDKVKLVADYFLVSMEYLLTGEEKQPTREDGLSETAIEIGKLIDLLPDEARKMILVQVQALAQARPNQAAPSKSE